MIVRIAIVILGCGAFTLGFILIVYLLYKVYIIPISSRTTDDLAKADRHNLNMMRSSIILGIIVSILSLITLAINDLGWFPYIIWFFIIVSGLLLLIQIYLSVRAKPWVLIRKIK